MLSDKTPLGMNDESVHAGEERLSAIEQRRLLREWVQSVDPERTHLPVQHMVGAASLHISSRVARQLQLLPLNTPNATPGRTLAALETEEECSIELLVDKSSGLANDEMVTLTVNNNCTEGPLAPSPSHWVGVYPNAEASINEVVPLKFVFPSHVDESYIETGVASVKLQLTNMRADYLLYLFTSNWEGYNYYTSDFGVGVYSGYLSYPKQLQALQEATAQAVSPMLSFAQPNEPLKPRVVPFAALPGQKFDGISSQFQGRVMQFLWSAKTMAMGSGNDTSYILEALFHNGTLPPCVNGTGGDALSQCEVCEEKYFDKCSSNVRVRVPLDGNMGTVDEFTVADLCDVPATTYGWNDPGLIVRALLPQASNEPRNVAYVLRNIDENGEYLSELLHFRFPPAPALGVGAEGISTRVACFGDMGRGTQDDTFTWDDYGTPSINTSLRLTAMAKAHEIDAVFHIGDISYATGYSAVWDEFLNMAAPFTSQVPYFILQGNHEYNADTNRIEWPASFTDQITTFAKNDSGGECGVAASMYLRSPSNTKPYGTYYSYEIGGLHIVGMNTEIDFTTGSEQYNWIQQDLESINRTATPFVLFGGHRPGYIDSDYQTSPSGDGDLQVSDLLVEHIEPLLVQFNVTMAIWGHNHAVQRMCSCYRGACVQKMNEATGVYESPPYPVHWVIGTAGAGFTKNAGGYGGNDNPPAPYTERVFYHWGVALATVYNSSCLGLEFVDSLSEEVIESFFITQEPDQFDPAPNNPFIPNPPGLILASLQPLSPPPVGGSDDNRGLSGGAIFGIILAVLLVAAMAGLVVVRYLRRRARYASSYLQVDMNKVTYSTFE